MNKRHHTKFVHEGHFVAASVVRVGCVSLRSTHQWTVDGYDAFQRVEPA